MQTISNIDIDNYLKTNKNILDNHLKKLFEDKNYTNPQELWEALRYSVLDAGKRIRGILCLATNESLNNIHTEDCIIVACSIELIHAMSLIHDDLPCMDNDDFRRGKPSCHKVFGEATAILAGDAMLSLAFNLIVEHTKKISLEQKLTIINILSKAFTFGLVPGQILDLSSSYQKGGDIAHIKNISKLKTAELINASILCGAVISLPKTKEEEHIMYTLSNFGYKVGTAFQIIDDILDITTDTKILGKTSGKDMKQNKSTYPLIIGLKNSKKMAKDLIKEAKIELNNIQIKKTILFSLADYITSRIN